MGDSVELNNKRQTINPLVDIGNAEVEPILKRAAKEFGFELPLAFAIYNQIRFYEEYGKLHVGMSVASNETLAKQFGVTVKQVQQALNNLTNKYKLGKWVIHDKPVFRNVKKTWVSYARLNQNYYSVTPKLLQRNSSTITAEQLASEVAPLSESKKKVSETILFTNVNKVNANAHTSQKTLFYELVGLLGFADTTKWTEQRRRKLNSRLKTFSEDDLRNAARAIADNAFLQGDNDSGKRYGTIDYLLRSDEQVDRWRAEHKPNQNIDLTKVEIPD